MASKRARSASAVSDAARATTTPGSEQRQAPSQTETVFVRGATQGACSWWALLYVDTDRGSKHTEIRISSDIAQILEQIDDVHAFWGEPDAEAVGAARDGAAPRWHLALSVGPFADAASAAIFCQVWATRCRGAKHRAARGEMLGRLLSRYSSVAVHCDLRVVLRDRAVYDHVRAQDAAATHST